MTVKQIVIGTDYAQVPGGRSPKFGPFSGEDFRDTVLVPALKAYDKVVVYLDDTKSLMSSFLEEAFGGLIRKSGFSYDDLRRRLVVDAKAPRYAIFVKMVQQDMVDAAAEVARQPKSSVA